MYVYILNNVGSEYGLNLLRYVLLTGENGNKHNKSTYIMPETFNTSFLLLQNKIRFI